MGIKKTKVSSVKRNQHLRHKKNVRQGSKKQEPTKEQLKKKSQNEQLLKKFFPNAGKGETVKKRKIKFLEPTVRASQQNDSDNDDQEIYDDLINMIDDDDDLRYDIDRKRKRKSTTEVDSVEDSKFKQFERQHAISSVIERDIKKRKVDLLPIKTKDGDIITRTTLIDKVVKNEEIADDDESDSGFKEEENSPEFDSDEDIINDDTAVKGESKKNAISSADLLILREQEISRQKYRIGIICSSIIENTEEKLKNIKVLFDLMGFKSSDGKQNILSVRKIAAISAAEVFKDVIPEYRIGQVDLKMQTVRKATMERVSFENTLLVVYKKYLQLLEKQTTVLNKKHHLTSEIVKLGEVATKCLCELLLAHPYFNFSQNIAQLLVFLLNSRFAEVRTTVCNCFMTFFKTDKKLDMTLYVVRKINALIKSKSSYVQVEVISCLKSLQIKDVDLDAKTDAEMKQKKLESHKGRILSLSKRERKRQKKLKVLDKELQETRAEESKQTQNTKLTDITKTLFTIYFRILKSEATSKLLGACLEGLAKFAHIINFDYFFDLVNVINKLLETGELNYKEELYCIQTVFTILSGQGEVLNIDLHRFYAHLYKNLMSVNLGKNHDDLMIILLTLNFVLLKRRKNISQSRLMAFVKRIGTLSLQSLHNGTLGCLNIIRIALQQTQNLDILLDTDVTTGSGRYDPFIDDPEYCNGSCSILWEIEAVTRHYHETVRKYGIHISAGTPSLGENSLNAEIGKLNSVELFEQFNSSEMIFNPAIPPRIYKGTPKSKFGPCNFIDNQLEKECIECLQIPLLMADRPITLDFYKSFSK